MKKRLRLLFCLVAVVTITSTGCQRTTDDDIYGTDNQVVVEETTDDTVLEETVTDQGVSEELDTTGDSEETVEETQEAEETQETVTEEVYDSENHVEAEDHEIEDVAVTLESIDDPEFSDAMMTFLDPIYYNVFFGAGDYVEGITEDDMIKFAVSYVYQHEYNELKFDTSAFILYVPEKRVEELVSRYFDYQVTRHHSFEEEGVMYEDGFYLMPAVDTGWSELMSIESITPTSDFSYDVVIALVTETTPDEALLYKASVEVRDGRFVLTAYVVDIPQEEASTDETAPAE